MAQRPPRDVDWIPDNSTGISVPSGPNQAAGWLVVKPARQFFNWLWNRCSRWFHYLSGQSQEYIIIDSVNANEKDYDTLVDYLADAPAVNDKVLVKEDQTITAQMIIPDGLTFKFLDGANLLCATDIATSLLKLGSDVVIEGVLNIVLSHTGTTGKAVEWDGDNNLADINIENSSTGTLTAAFVINSGKKGNKFDAIVENTGGGTITDVVQDDSLESTNAVMVRDINNDKIITLPPRESNENILSNGCLSIFQEGLNITSGTIPANDNDTYVAGQTILLSEGNDVVDVSRDKTDIPTGSRSSIHLEVETANLKFGILKPVLGLDSRKIIGGVASLSFKAKRTGTTLGNIRAAVLSWDGAEDSITSDVISAWGAEGVNPTLVANWTFENVASDLILTTAYQEFKIENVSIDTSGTTNIAVLIWSDDTATTVGDILHITDINLIKGSRALPFEVRLFEQEVALDQVFFEKSYNLAIAPGTPTDSGEIVEFASRNNALVTPGSVFQTTKRSQPTVTIYAIATGNPGNITNSGDKSASADKIGTHGFGRIDITVGIIGSGAEYHYTADSRL